MIIPSLKKIGKLITIIVNTTQCIGRMTIRYIQRIRITVSQKEPVRYDHKCSNAADYLLVIIQWKPVRWETQEMRQNGRVSSGVIEHKEECWHPLTAKVVHIGRKLATSKVPVCYDSSADGGCYNSSYIR